MEIQNQIKINYEAKLELPKWIITLRQALEEYLENERANKQSKQK
jgi:hypothetical protein